MKGYTYKLFLSCWYQWYVLVYIVIHANTSTMYLACIVVCIVVYIESVMPCICLYFNLIHTQ